MKSTLTISLTVVLLSGCFSETPLNVGDWDSTSDDNAYDPGAWMDTSTSDGGGGTEPASTADTSTCLTAKAEGSFVQMTVDPLLAPVDTYVYESIRKVDVDASPTTFRELEIVLTETAGECALAMHGMTMPTRKEARIVVRTEANASNGDLLVPPPIAVGVYAATGDATKGGLALQREGGQPCSAVGTATSSEEILDGKVTITDRTDTAVHGEVDVKDSSGTRIHFSFSAPVCRPAAQKLLCCQ